MKQTAKSENEPTNIDLREQLFNDGEKGDIKAVSIPRDQITRLNAVMVDLDPEYLIFADAEARGCSTAVAIYDQMVKAWLERHPTLAKAEVRRSGKGLHLLLWLNEPIIFSEELDRQRWQARVQIIQRIFPSDPAQPSIEAKTRPLGSVNGKNGVQVTQLREGAPVTEGELLDLVDTVLDAKLPFISNILFGQAHNTCPLCQQPSLTRCSATSADCYTCGKLSCQRLMDSIMITPKVKKEAAHAQA
jgi:hypothetical protein